MSGVAAGLSAAAEQIKWSIRALVTAAADAHLVIAALAGNRSTEARECVARLLIAARGGASIATLRRRATYGGRKGRRAARRLRAAGVAP